MKKMMVALLFLVAISSVASAQTPTIGMYAEADVPVLCSADVLAYATTSVYFWAILPPEIAAITACEFAVDNLPDAAMAITTPLWNTGLVIGDVGWNLAQAFSPALAGPNAFLGQLDFFVLNDTLWDDFLMTVIPGNDSGVLVVVDDSYVTHDANVDSPQYFTFNCSATCDCVDSIATDDATFSNIKALY